MKKISSNYKKGKLKLKIENLDDLWALNQVLDPGDLIKAKTTRKIKLGQKGEKQEAIKKTITLEIKLEKIDFGREGQSLRLRGISTEDREEMPKGASHSLTIEEGSVLAIKKEKWLNYQIKIIDEASKTKRAPILICLMDREESIFAQAEKRGYEILSKIKGEAQKKGEPKSVGKEKYFLKEIVSQLGEYNKRYQPTNIILASPAFWKEELYEKLPDELKKKTILSSCSSVSLSAISEVLKRPEIKTALKQQEIIKETNLVEDMLVEISKGGLAVYGWEEVKTAGEMGAIKTLLLTSSFLKEMKEKKRFQEVDALMRQTEKRGGEVHLISAEHEAGEKLAGLGGAGALLRYKIK